MSSRAALPVSRAYPSAGRCILVVEDELLIRFPLSEALRDVGFQVIEASNADEALDVLATVSPDLVISDVRMPGSLDGLGLLAIIRSRFPSLPVIIVSGHLPPSLALQDGATQFLSKPYDIEAVFQAIDAELGAAI